MMFNVQNHHRAYEKLLPKWFKTFVIKNMFVDNGYYELKNVDGSSYLNHVDHDKLKKVLDM